MEKENETKLSVEEFFEKKSKFENYEFPKVTVVLPTYNCSEKISLTIESVLSQIYPDFELLVVDAGSTDRTLEVIKNYRDERLKIYTVSGYRRYEMHNKAISQAKGTYINFLFPGDFYIHNRTLRYMMEVALEHGKPHMVFCGTFLRDGKTEPKILLRKFSLDLLKIGQQPTSLQSCWFITDMIRDLGKFKTDYFLRGGYELMCRIKLQKNLLAIGTPRVLIDYDLRLVTLKMVVYHFVETFKTVLHYFGFFTTIRWLIVQKDFRRIVKLWLRGVKVAFLGR